MYLSAPIASAHGFGDTTAGHTDRARQYMDAFDKQLAALNARPGFCGDAVTFGALYVLNGTWGQIAANMSSVSDSALEQRYRATSKALDEVNLRYSNMCIGKAPSAPSCPPCKLPEASGMSTKTKVFIGAGLALALAAGYGFARS